MAFAFTSEIDPANEVTGPRVGRGTTRPQQGFELVEADSQAALEDFMGQIPAEEVLAALELEDFSTGSDITETEEIYYLQDQDIEEDTPEDDEEDYEPSTPGDHCHPHHRNHQKTLLSTVQSEKSCRKGSDAGR